MKNTMITTGLFGTCGGSEWRAPFMNSLSARGLNFFNPQVEEWDESMALIEADHLANDQIILFPITGETYATGSLAETGFSILQAINMDRNRYFVIHIDMKLDEGLKENAALYKESMRARALVLQHLKKLQLANVFLVDSMEDMLEVTLKLNEILIMHNSISKYSLGA